MFYKCLRGSDVFTVLPTHYGKMACFACIAVLSHNKLIEKSSIIVVFASLTAFIEDKVNILTRYDVSLGYVDMKLEADVKMPSTKDLIA